MTHNKNSRFEKINATSLILHGMPGAGIRSMESRQRIADSVILPLSPDGDGFSIPPMSAEAIRMMMEVNLESLWMQLAGTIPPSMGSIQGDTKPFRPGMLPPREMRNSEAVPQPGGAMSRQAGGATSADPDEKARAKGYSQQEIDEAKEKVKHTGNDDKNCGFADDPLCMLVATPEQKGKMCKRLIDGHTTGKEDRAMVSILQSAENREEFDAIIEASGGKAIRDELDDDQARKKYDRLCGGYDRVDLACNKKEAEKTKGVLNDPYEEQRLLGGADSYTAEPRHDSGYSDGNGYGKDPLDAQTDRLMRNQRSMIDARVSSLDRRTVVETVTENAVREQEGKELINPRDIRQQVDSIMNDPALSKDEREKKINELRKENDLSKYTMRNIATQPISHIYGTASREAAGYKKQVTDALEKEVKEAESTFGKDSLQTKAAKERLKAFKEKMSPYVNYLSNVSGTLNDMYPPPKGFWGSLGSFFAGIAKAVAPALLNLIPGVGTALYIGSQAAMAVYDGAKGNWLGVLGDIAGIAGGVGGAIGGATGKGLTTGADVAKEAIGLGKSIEGGNPLDIIGAAGGFAGDLGGLSEGLGKVTGTVSDGLDYAGTGVKLYQGIESGDAGKILGSLAPYSDLVTDNFKGNQLIQDMANYGGQGISLANNLMDGNYGGALNTVAGNFSGNQLIQDMANYGGQGFSVVNNLMDGNYTAALNGATGMLGELDNPLAGTILNTADQGRMYLNSMADQGRTYINSIVDQTVIQDIMQAFGQTSASPDLLGATGLF